LEDLVAATRLRRLLARLERELDLGAAGTGTVNYPHPRPLFALQEVSMAWSGPLHCFFASRGYQFVVARYGKRFDGYMGVGLAYPGDGFEALEVEVQNVADSFRSLAVAVEQKEEQPTQDLRRHLKWALSFAFSGGFLTSGGVLGRSRVW
jgi:hypothetical protein